LKILGPNIISVHENSDSLTKQLKFHVLEDTNGVPKIVETKINENIADKLSSCLKQHYYRIEHFRLFIYRHKKFTRYITWSSHHQAILCLGRATVEEYDSIEKEYRVDFVNLTGVRIFKIELRPDYQASEEIFRMDKWYEADICDYQNLIRANALNYEFDLDKNYLIMEHTDSRHLIRGSMTKISIWNLGSGFYAI
jgi:hypothetical protein